MLVSLMLLFVLAQAVSAQKTENTLLWEISGKDLKKSSYLFGTYHFADKGFIDTMKNVNAKLEESEAIVGELVIDSTLALKVLPYMMLKGTTLDQLLTPADYKLVANELKKVSNYDLNIFNGMNPTAVQLTIMQFSTPKTFTKDNPAIDEYFQIYGKANHKPVYGLETVDEQGKILFGSSLQRQVALLIKSVKESAKNNRQSKELYANYIAQDLEKIAILLKDTGGYTTVEMDEMLKNRNVRWMEKLPVMMRDKSLFIAIGAAHLIGKDGLIKGLQAKGYNVKPLSTN
jgi:uncharacterized protein YbaP (TraB family)